MAAPIIDLGAQMMCPHGGLASPVTTNSRVLVNGSPALLVGDRFPIGGCPVQAPPDGGDPQPCTEIVWSAPSTRVLVNGVPVLLASSTGPCITAKDIPQGQATLAGVKPRVLAH